tara:strand:- start:519 stop:662 length:144 start_codon:yes stop_codon:yes gene_type:complete
MKLTVTFSGYVPEECNDNHRQYDTQRGNHIERTCIIENTQKIGVPVQ